MKNNILKSPFTWIIIALLAGGAGYAAIASGLVNLDFLSRETPVESKEFVAQVNGEGVKTALFELRLRQAQQIYQAQGATLSEEDTDLLRQQLLQEMIDEILLAQYGKEQGLQANDEMVQNEYDSLISQFTSEEEFRANLAAQGATLDDVRHTIAQDLILQQVIEQQTAQHASEISEEEIQQAYDEAVQQGDEVPPLEEARPQIELFLQQQKTGQLINALVEELRENAEIQILS